MAIQDTTIQDPTNTAQGKIGQATPRIDGHAKVTGAALYPSDEQVAHPAYAWLVTSGIASGDIQSFDLTAARSVKGVLDILTYENVSKDAKPPKPLDGGKTTTTLESSKIWHDGQIIGVVVAETLEAAREGAQAVGVTYRAARPAATFGSPGADEEKRKDKQHKDISIGHAAQAFDAAPVKVDQRYATPTQHHNAMELFTTTCAWNGDHLTIYEPTQFLRGEAATVAQQLGLKPEQVTVVSRFIGGGFGGKGGATARTAWIAVAAKRLGRPVKLVATRDQGFTIATYRAETQHRIRLAADRNGKLQSLIHDGWEATSRPSGYNVSGNETTARMYACPNVETSVHIVHADRNTPGFMRAPPETPYMFPLEVAMDELAHQLGIDPVELRRINDTQHDQVEDKQFSTRSLMKCYDAAAAKFGWAKRDPKPGSMRDGDWLIGYGCATACYPTNISPASARVILHADGSAKVETGGHEIGNGMYTIVAITAADRLGLPVDKVAVEVGLSTLPAAGIAGGSSQTASVCNAVAQACDALRLKLGQLAATQSGNPFFGKDFSQLKLAGGKLVAPDGTSQDVAPMLRALPGKSLAVLGEYIPNGLPDSAMGKIEKGQMTMSRGDARKDVTAYAFGAHFVELRIHSRTCEIRAPRMVSAFASGTIVNPMAAHSQYMGGMIWGLSSALHEKTDIDLNAARYTNDNLAEYLIPVNADIGSVEAIMISEEDAKVNPLGIKGIGEIGIVGVSAAVSNAVFHATGKRIRRLPIRIEDLV